jgi:hypothetical protein
MKNNGLNRVNENGKYGYKDNLGSQVIPCVYENAFEFFDGLALVSVNKKWGYINSRGLVVFKCIWDSNQIGRIRIPGSSLCKSLYHFDATRLYENHIMINKKGQAIWQVFGSDGRLYDFNSRELFRLQDRYPSNPILLNENGNLASYGEMCYWNEHIWIYSENGELYLA